MPAKDCMLYIFIIFFHFLQFIYSYVVIYCVYVVAALSKAQRNLSKTLTEFRFECIGSEQTDDEIIIGKYLLVLIC